jgi:hypothetical protein
MIGVTGMPLVVLPGVAVAGGGEVGVLVGVGAAFVGVGVGTAFVGVGVGVFVGVGVGVFVGVGVGVLVGVGVGVGVIGVGVGVGVVGVGVGVVGVGVIGVGVLVAVVVVVDVVVVVWVCFVTEFTPVGTVAAMACVLVTSAIALISEHSNNMMERTPITILLGVSLAQMILPGRRTLREFSTVLFFIFAYLGWLSTTTGTIIRL